MIGSSIFVVDWNEPVMRFGIGTSKLWDFQEDELHRLEAALMLLATWPKKVGQVSMRRYDSRTA